MMEEVKMKLLVKSGWKTVLFIIMTFFLVSPLLSFASQWVNPRDQFKDVNEVRLQRGKTELSETEKQEVKKYGSTGLELMTYLFFNQEPGDHDYDSCWNIYNISPNGRILKTVASDKNIYRLKNNKVDLVTLNGIKPGDVWRR
jgi:hypothetical protein